MSVAILDSERFTEIVDGSTVPGPAVRSAGKASPPRPQKSNARANGGRQNSNGVAGLHIYTPWDDPKLRSPFDRAAELVDPAMFSAGSFNSPLFAALEKGNVKPVPISGRKSSIPDRRISEVPVSNNFFSRSPRLDRQTVGPPRRVSLGDAIAASELSSPGSTYLPAAAGTGQSSPQLSPQVGGPRRESTASNASSSIAKPLRIRRKQPAVYAPAENELPVSRSASLVGHSRSGSQATLQSQNSPLMHDALALPLSPTYDTPLKRIAKSDETPPATPPVWTGSSFSGSNTEEDSMPVSPRSSGGRYSSKYPTEVPQGGTFGRKLQYGQVATPPPISPLPVVPPRTPIEEADMAFLAPFVCSIDEMQDRPGMLRRDSDSSTDMEDDDSVRNLGLESFPVPSVIVNSANNTPRMAKFPSTSSPRTPGFSPVMGFESLDAYRRASLSTGQRAELYRIPTNPHGEREWDQATELEIRDRVFRAEIGKPNKPDKLRRKQLSKTFDQFATPKTENLYEASLLSVRDENGHKVRFGSLFEGQKTIVCFIRHFWCTQCQNYVEAVSKVRPEVLEKHNMRLVVVSNGSWKMIKGYKKFLGNKCPYPIYTDRPRHIYTALGMTLRTWDAGKEKDRGNYIQHSLGGSVVAGIKAGVALPMKPPGDQQQLGGEFILGPGLEVSFCHRMKTTRGHAEIEDVLASAGINLAEETAALGMANNASTPAGSQPGTPKVKEKQSRKSMRSSGIFSLGSGSTASPRPTSPLASSNGPQSPKLGSGNESPAMRNRSVLKKKQQLKQQNRSSLPVPVSTRGISSADVFGAANTANGTLSCAMGNGTADAAVADDEDAIFRDAAKNRQRKHSSAPALPTPDTVTPLSTGFLQVPSQHNSFYSARQNSSTSEVDPLQPQNEGSTALTSSNLHTTSGLAGSCDLETSSSRFSDSSEENASRSRRPGSPAERRLRHRSSTDSRSSNNGNGNGKKSLIHRLTNGSGGSGGNLRKVAQEYAARLN